MKVATYISIIFILMASSYAALYSDVTFLVSETGEVEIAGNTNYEPFAGTTQQLTSKEGNYWVLNITAPTFEEFIYHIQLPKYATINYIKANTPVRIEDMSGTLTITSTGSQKPIEVLIQYSIGKSQASAALRNAIFTLIGIGLFVVFINYIIGSKSKKKEEIKETSEPAKKELDRKRFTERQLEIIDYLQEHGTVTQAEVEKALELPKSSLSRNIDTLVQKGTIFKEAKGMSNVIGLKD